MYNIYDNYRNSKIIKCYAISIGTSWKEKVSNTFVLKRIRRKKNEEIF